MDEKGHRQEEKTELLARETDVHDLYEPSREAYDGKVRQTNDKNVRR